MLGLLVVTMAIGLVSCVLAPRALAIAAPIHIANTGGEGVFIRSEPNKSSARLGWMAEGTSPDYHCFVWGENINGVPIWFNVTHSGITGYYASYFDDSSYHSNEELTAKYGIPLCGAALPPIPSPPQPPAQPPQPPTSPGPGPGGGPGPGPLIELLPEGGSAYYAPDDGKHRGAPSPATLTLAYGTWTSGNCGTGRVGIPASWGGKLLTTLAGFSIGRLGPIYFLQANRGQSSIHYILLLDPGDRQEYEDKCDKHYPQSHLLAEWLSHDGRNRLAIIAGKVTADAANPDHGHGHAGIQDTLFPKIRGRAIADQVVVCNYNRMEHWDVFKNFATWMNKPAITRTTCPWKAFGWNP